MSSWVYSLNKTSYMVSSSNRKQGRVREDGEYSMGVRFGS